MPTVSDIGEDALVRRLTAPLHQDVRVLTGPGDDCAVVERPEGRLLLKADAIIEGIHFTRDAEPQLIGRKALARAISDIAAMGGVPRHALVTLVLSGDTEVAFVEALYAGMAALAQQFGVSIVGGETSRGAQLMISVALTGEVPHAWLCRNAAQVGDAIFVTGHLGGSITGKHLTFTPRVEQSQWLMQHHRPNAMMDLSDGPAKDLPRMATASGADFIIDEAALPCTPGCTAAQAWGDGEDYELLFTIGDEQAGALQRDWSNAFPSLELTRIGTLVAKGEGRVPSFTTQGWEHFK